MKVILPILTKIGFHGNMPREMGKRGPDRSYSCKYPSFCEKIVKIGPVNLEIIGLQLQKKITEGKIYSLIGKFAERAK